MKKGDKVQVWDEHSHQCLGWGTIIKLAISVKDSTSGKIPEGIPLIELAPKDIISKRTPEEIPLIKLETGKMIWGNRCYWIEEKKATEIGVRLFQDIHQRHKEASLNGFTEEGATDKELKKKS